MERTPASSPSVTRPAASTSVPPAAPTSATQNHHEMGHSKPHTASPSLLRVSFAAAPRSSVQLVGTPSPASSNRSPFTYMIGVERLNGTATSGRSAPPVYVPD